MKFIEIAVIDIDGEAAETVGELFNRYGEGGAVVEAYPPHFDRVTVRTIIPAEDNDRLHKIEALLALIGQALPSGLPSARLRTVGQNDWATSWKEHFHVIHIGRRFVIKPGWREYTPTTYDIVIEIDPDLAFGSGLHPTTQLCLKILEDMALSGQSLFDVGTGSGILTVAALKLGAYPVRAVDVDAVSVRVARENLERNGCLSSAVEIAVGSATDSGEKQQWQVVVANILAHILIDIMDGLISAIAPKGRLILSGILSEQEGAIKDVLSSYPVHITARHTDGDWTAFVVERR